MFNFYNFKDQNETKKKLNKSNHVMNNYVSAL
jgi:hypothetical protein